jgi:ATP-binding cassette subfamily D (ALD) protein 2
MEKIFRKKLWYITIEQFLIKYVWNTAGCCIIAMPLLLSLNQGESVAEGVSLRTKAYTTGRHYLMNGADAMERIMTSYKEVCVYIFTQHYFRVVCGIMEHETKWQNRDL